MNILAPYQFNNYQRGQSTTELTVVALVLVPLMLIVPLLGKYMDIAQTTIVASRYVAFEGTVHHTSTSNGGWKSDASLANEVRRRFFSKNDLSIKTNDVAGNFNADRNPLWFDHKGNPLLPDFNNNIGVKTERINMTQPFGAFYTGAFNLDQNNLYKGEVNVNIANIADVVPFDAINLVVKRHTALLVDPWTATGPGMVTDAIQDADVAFPYKVPLKPTAAVLSFGLNLFEPSTSEPDVGRVAPDFVPNNRVLQPYQ